jgi:hypothetical protein
MDAAATKAWMGALLGLVFLARAAQGTTPINDLKFSHDRKGAQYEFSFEDVLTENARSLVEAFGRRIRDSDEPFYTEDGLKTMSTLGSPSAPRRRMFVARLQNPGNRPEARHFNQGDIVAANQCDQFFSREDAVDDEGDDICEEEGGCCNFAADAGAPNGGYPCGYLSNANTVRAFEGDKISQEFSYQCFGEFLHKSQGLNFVFVKNWGRCNGAISYTKGAYAAGFNWFKKKTLAGRESDWIQIPSNLGTGGRRANTYFLHCLNDGRCPNTPPDQLSEFDANQCRDGEINQIKLMFKFDADRPTDEFDEHHTENENGTPYYANRRTRRTTWTDRRLRGEVNK